MKSSRMKKILAVILCLTLGLSTNMMTMAESVNSPAVESVQEDPAGSGKEQTVENAALQTTSVENTETEAVSPTEAPVPTEAPTPETTPAPTETAVPEVTAEPTEAPVEEATPVPTETPTPEVTAEPTEAPVEETTPVPTEEATPEVTEEPTEETKKPEDMDIEKLYQYLSKIKDGNEYEKIWGSLSETKKQELWNYIQGIKSGETYDYDNTDGIVSNLNVAPLILDEEAFSSTTKKVCDAAENGIFNSEGKDPEDGLEIKKEITEYDSETGKGKLKLEAYVTGEITSISRTIPLDIVLVLDQSGSMDNSFGRTNYIMQDYTNGEALERAKNKTLYAYQNGEYAEVRIEKVQGSIEKVKEFLSNKTTFEDVYENSDGYYYDIANQSYSIRVRRSWEWGKYNYQVYAGNRIIAEGKGGETVNDHMTQGYLAGIYRWSQQDQSEYQYILQDSNKELGVSTGADGMPPVTLFENNLWGSDIKKIDSLKTAASNFVDSVVQNAVDTGVDHRIAVVGFASGSEWEMSGYSGSEFENTELFIGKRQIGYDDIELSDYNTAFQSVLTQTGKDNLRNSINSLAASGGTWPKYGFEMANSIFENNKIEEESGRKRIVIMFSDGEPGNSGFDTTQANSTISEAYKSKNTYNANVYSIGIFDDANGNVKYESGSKPTAVPESGWGWNDLKANKFMHLISQNFPKAPNMNVDKNTISTELTLIDENKPSSGYNSYYLSAKNSDELSSVFEKIADEIGGAKITLGAETVLQDVMSEYFEVDTTEQDGIVAYTMTTDDNGASWAKDESSENNLSITSSNGCIHVTGFDYSENYVAEGHIGKKLVVEVPISYKNEASFGGNNIPTNAGISGVYDGTGTECFGNFEIPVVNQPIDYKVGTVDKKIYLSNSTVYSELLEYIKQNEKEYKPDGVKNKFVTIKYILKTIDGQKLGELQIDSNKSVEECSWNWESDLSERVRPVQCAEFQIICEITPKEQSETNWGEKAIQKTLVSGEQDQESIEKNPWIHVVKPVVTMKDMFVFLGDEVNLESINREISWEDFENNHANNITVEGEEPDVVVNLKFVAGTQPVVGNVYKPKKDSDFTVESLEIGTESYTDNYEILYRSMEHDGCIENDSISQEESELTIHVVSGKVTLEKKINLNEVQESQGDPIFTFKLTRTYNGESTSWYQSVRFTKKQIEQNKETATVIFDQLPKGEYTVQEVNSGSLQFKQESLQYSVESTSNYPCISTAGGLKIGMEDNGGQQRVDTRDGLVTIVNCHTGDETDTDSDIVVNRFKIENGKVVITPDKLEAEN